MNKDLLLKNCIQIPKHFCDLYNGSIFAGKQIVKPEDLIQLPAESIAVFGTAPGKQEAIGRYHDIVYEHRSGNQYMILPIG